MQRLDLPARATSPKRAREFVRDTLVAWDVDDPVATDAELLVTELVTNSVRHAGAAVRIAVSREDARLHFSIFDEGPGRPRSQVPGPNDLSGRGLLILERLASDWEVTEHADGGKTVHFWLERTTANHR